MHKLKIFWFCQDCSTENSYNFWVSPLRKLLKLLVIQIGGFFDKICMICIANSRLPKKYVPQEFC